MTKPAYIYFDLDNTLLNHSSAESAAQKETFESFQELQEAPYTKWIETYRTVNHYLWELYQKGEVDRHQLQRRRFYDSMGRLGLNNEVSEKIGDAYMEIYRKHWVWVEGAEEALERISETFPTGIITNGFRETQQLKFKKMDLSRYCNRFLISEDVGVMKPHPKVFDRATEMAGVDRSGILYVGDSYSSDIVGGKSAGWSTAWFTAFLNGDEEGDLSDFRFNDFDELLDYLEL